MDLVISDDATETSRPDLQRVAVGGPFENYPLAPPYAVGRPFDETFTSTGEIRVGYKRLTHYFGSLSSGELALQRDALERTMRTQGITFTVHHGGDESGDVERTLPLDVMPRVVSATEWRMLEQGLAQRLRALNAFLADVYSGQEIIRDGVIPAALVLTARHFTRQVFGLNVRDDIWIHIYGPDLIRDVDGRWLVLEDNTRTPSGVSYVIENRAAMMRALPDIFGRHRVASVDHYPQLLLHALRSAAPHAEADPTIAVLTPGSFNSAYSEHTFLGRQMGVEIVEGGDLFVDEAVVYMKTTHGRERVDVIYRRIDDDFLDPVEFRHDSLLGVAGLMTACRAGNVALANSVGTGIADDKAIFPYVPEMIRYYLGEEPLLGQVPTLRCGDPDQLPEILARLDDLVVKPVAASGGYGVVIGPLASDAELAVLRAAIERDPNGFIAQPTINLSMHPTLVGRGVAQRFAPRHLDLRPFVLASPDGVRAIPGGLSRVAMPEGSMVVNSSQGGGSKDTWVLEMGSL